MTQQELRDRIRISRRDRTIIVGKTNIVSTIKPSFQPPILSQMIVTVSGATAFGTVTIKGSDSKKQNQEEAIVFSTNENKTTTKYFETIAEIACSGFTGGEIEVRSTFKDFADGDIDYAIETALNDYSNYNHLDKEEKFSVVSSNEYSKPTGCLWIKSVNMSDGVPLIWETWDSKFRIKGIDQNSFLQFTEPSKVAILDTTTFTEFKLYFAKRKEIEDLLGNEIGLVSLRADAELDKMLMNEPNRYVDVVVNVPGMEKLQVSNLYLEAYERKMEEYKKLVGVAQGVRT